MMAIGKNKTRLNQRNLLLLTSLSLFMSLSLCLKGQPLPQNSRQAKNVIYLIGDGMSLPQIYGAMLATGRDLSFKQFPYCGLVTTRSASNEITDSSASGTALSCGKKTKNGMVGMDPDSIPVKSVLEAMAEQGKMTGIVVTSYVTHATPAVFYAKVPKRSYYEDIAIQLLNSDKVNVIIGGGRKYFNQRKDGRDLIEEMQNKGWKVYDTLANIDVANSKYAVLANDGHMPSAVSRGDFLPEATKTALQTLSKHEKGFFMMVEGSQIDFACHESDSATMVAEMLDFDKTLRVALDFAQKDGNTLVVVTADHETGGLTMIDPQGRYSSPCFSFSTHSHTCLPVAVFAFGPGAERFTGWMDNTEIVGKIMNACGFEALDATPSTKQEMAPIRENFDSKRE